MVLFKFFKMHVCCYIDVFGPCSIPGVSSQTKKNSLKFKAKLLKLAIRVV